MHVLKKRNEPSVLYALPTKPSQAGWATALHARVLKALQAVTQEDEFVYADDWQHASYILYPHQLTKWPNITVRLIPNGDTYCIAAKDGRFRITAQFPDWTLTVQGNEFICCLDGFWLGDCLWLDPGIDLEAELRYGLAQLLNNKIPRYAPCVQAHVAKLLAERGYREALEIVQPLLRHPDINVRFDAALACLYLGDEQSLAVLRSILTCHVVPEGYDYCGLHQLRYERVLEGLTFLSCAAALQTEALSYLEQTSPSINVELALDQIQSPTRLTQFPKPRHDPEDGKDPRYHILCKLAIDLGQMKEQVGLDCVLAFLTDCRYQDSFRYSYWRSDCWPYMVQALVSADHRNGLQQCFAFAASLTDMAERAILYSELTKAFIHLEDKIHVEECFRLAQQAIDTTIADGLNWYAGLGLKALAHAYFLLGDTVQALATARRISDEEIYSEAVVHATMQPTAGFRIPTA
jgi:hypothetical protein